MGPEFFRGAQSPFRGFNVDMIRNFIDVIQAGPVVLQALLAFFMDNGE
ncbi:hypothetical protein PBAL39_10271 [Pedobacter sp. BAL39]|nr:hypothetical protein PBAL39_10271 [Pedobacter sp. BAL39]